MKAGTVLKLPDERIGTVVYNGLDGVGIKWGRHEVTLEEIGGTGGVFGESRIGPYKWHPDAMLRDPYDGCDLPCVGLEFEVLPVLEDGVESSTQSVTLATLGELDTFTKHDDRHDTPDWVVDAVQEDGWYRCINNDGGIRLFHSSATVVVDWVRCPSCGGEVSPDRMVGEVCQGCRAEADGLCRECGVETGGGLCDACSEEVHDDMRFHWDR